MSRLLVDTDIFCKLGIAGLLEQAIGLFGIPLAECGCLPALPHMLRRGRLPKVFGAEACGKLIPLAESLSATALPTTPSLERLVGVDRIDVGEAQLLAIVADLDALMLTGDKRALAAVAQLPDYPQLLAGKIVTLEAVLLSLCMTVGNDAVRLAVQQIIATDVMVRVCFSSASADPRDGLRSYITTLKRDVAPLQLWEPVEENG
jgi:hypothetical protein